ncbi:MAG TPA: cytochrome c biogenesis protein CcdA [Candidatus Binatia bacterium]|nr:cytochrome c biogenesis protein CcdA [Candidatus Binatia bacterium]
MTVGCILASLVASAALAADPAPIPAEIVRLKVESATYSPEHDALDVLLLAEIAAGWHVNAHRPTSDALIPTTLSVNPPPGFDVGEIEYPVPQRRTLGFAAGETLLLYSGQVRFRIPLVVKTAFTEAGTPFEATLRYQACDDTRCLRPTDVKRTFVVKRPATFDAKSASRLSNQSPVESWLSRYGLAPTLALVFLMGLGLNLTPCVYPLISVTVAYFGGQARERRARAVVLASAYALGIALTFSALGVAAALSGGLFGQALQRPATLVLLGALMVALALSSFGAYTFQPPAWMLQRFGRAAGGLAGALFMGLTMGVVAAPCVGPIVVGLLLAVGARGETGFGFLLFFTLALGLGAPYVVVGAAASSIARLPRSGEWLVWVERVFGFVLLGLALYFVGPLLPSRVLPWATAGLIACAGITLGFLDGHGRHLRYFAVFKRTAGVIALLAALGVALPALRPPQAGATISWREFSTQALDEARAQGRPAVVDFRADWCLPCLEMERTTFVAPEVTSRVGDFEMLRADVTEMSEKTENLLSKYGVLGVPTTIFFAADGKEQHRMVGYVASDDFVRLLDETRATRAGAAGSASPAAG